MDTRVDGAMPRLAHGIARDVEPGSLDGTTRSVCRRRSRRRPLIAERVQVRGDLLSCRLLLSAGARKGHVVYKREVLLEDLKNVGADVRPKHALRGLVEIKIENLMHIVDPDWSLPGASNT